MLEAYLPSHDSYQGPRSSWGSQRDLMKYGPNGECLHTLQHEKISKLCLLALSKEPTAKLFFNYKLSFEHVLWKEKSRLAEQGRTMLLRVKRQRRSAGIISYEDALWCDLIFPPTKDGDYPLNSKSLQDGLFDTVSFANAGSLSVYYYCMKGPYAFGLSTD
ncbi:hypothetical protein DHEL01_v209821 [Diaporthe helianthi]|uniref:Uncharacterized protein n=1 Tax=Diaporthe helianthi TaxID=158607 RepID=A0A2P5HNF8_DIAHE|nr:hypothetical protein DHEL01_v209821 [Diaporthe helianthi]